MIIQIPDGLGLVALSGGADSVALLRLAVQAHANVVALHCNFQLRGAESRHDEQFVRQLCGTLGVPLHVRAFATEAYANAHGISLEMAARDLRYAWFHEMRQELDAQWIAVAHHREDQAETVLLNLLRGTGIKGLGGMQERNGYVIRPLLHHSKQEILDYLASIGQAFVTDSTNLERDALRNRLRLDVMPLLREINPQAIEHICQTADIVRSMPPTDECPSPPYTPFTLHTWLHPLGFTLSQQRDILRHLDGSPGAMYESPTHRLLRDRGRLIVEAKQATSLPTVRQQIIEVQDAIAFLRKQPKEPRFAYLDADKLFFPLTHRLAETGDSIQPFGMKGKRKLVSDLLTNLKFNRFQKGRQSVMLSKGEIVWVVGVRSAEPYRLTEHTKRVLVMEVAE